MEEIETTVADLTAQAVIIGAGIYGCKIALALAEKGLSVLLLDREVSILNRASSNNQARVHGGYHYPRSIATAFQCQANYNVFCEEFKDSINNTFKSYYAISRHASSVSAKKFVAFCKRIGAPVRPVTRVAQKYFNPHLIEAAFEVEECVYNAQSLKSSLESRILTAGVNLLLNCNVEKIAGGANNNCLEVEATVSSTPKLIKANNIFICAYSETNQILSASGLPILPVRNELTEIVLVEVPEIFQDIGVTIMCGPFFSLLPFPSRNLHSLSHVRFTPHLQWDSDEDVNQRSLFTNARDLKSAFTPIKADAMRYVPQLKEIIARDSIWEKKAILPVNDRDDGRPILFRMHYPMQNVHCILGGKIDNVYDIVREIQKLL